MPYTWLVFSTKTAPLIEGKKPRAIRDIAREIGGRKGGSLVDVYFDVGKEVGYALFKDLGDSADAKRASRDLGGVGYTKMLDADQAEDALYGEAEASR